MGMCLRGKREAERQYSESVSYKCIKSNAELEDNIEKWQLLMNNIKEERKTFDNDEQGVYFGPIEIIYRLV